MKHIVQLTRMTPTRYAVQVTITEEVHSVSGILWCKDQGEGNEWSYSVEEFHDSGHFSLENAVEALLEEIG